jgi:ZIP family zinc transporter
MENMLLGSVISALSTGLSAVPILFLPHIYHYAQHILVALAAEIMMVDFPNIMIPPIGR